LGLSSKTQKLVLRRYLNYGKKQEVKGVNEIIPKDKQRKARCRKSKEGEKCTKTKRLNWQAVRELRRINRTAIIRIR